jgi:hypothetical protein
VIELDPLSVDVSIERWQRLTGATAHHAVSGHRTNGNIGESRAEMFSSAEQ